MLKSAFVIPSIIRGDKDKKLLQRLIASMVKYEPDQLAHTWIVDDASTHPDSMSFYESLMDEFDVKVLFKPCQESYSSMINLAFREIMKAGYPFFATVNNDIELTSPIVDTLLATFSLSNRIAVVGPLLLYPSGKVQSAGFEVNGHGEPMEYNKHQYFVPDPSFEFNKPRCTMGVTGAFQMIRTSTFVPLMGYNEEYLMGFEDVEFCIRAWSKGAWVFYQPNSIAVHAESVTRGRVPCKRQLHSSHLFQQRAGTIPLGEIKARINQANKVLEEAINAEG